jgi:hypothetical protein
VVSGDLEGFYFIFLVVNESMDWGGWIRKMIVVNRVLLS